jgi:putative transposase
MPRRSAPIILSPEQKAELESLVRAHSIPQQLALRAHMILLADTGLGVSETASRLGAWRKTVSCWRARWLKSPAETPVTGRLADAPRPGTPPTFTAEQICAIVALACEAPRASGLPLTHWSQSALARQAIKRGLVETISQRQVGRILKRSRPSAAPLPALAHAEARPSV